MNIRSLFTPRWVRRLTPRAREVAKWAGHLDADQPGWANRVPERWNINSISDCLLYHVYGGYGHGMDRMHEFGAILGDLPAVGTFSSASYQPYWQAEINKRQADTERLVQSLIKELETV